MKKILFLVVALFSLVFVSCDNKKYNVVTTTFVGYDAARAVLGDSSDIKMLMKPGSDIHSYEPSATDIKSVLNAKVFIYIGGESDSEWVEKDILGNVKDKDIKIVNMFDVLEDNLILEEGEEDEYDEHVWTSPVNYIKIVDAVKDALIKTNLYDNTKLETNTTSYINKLKEVDKNIEAAVKMHEEKTIVVADRFPLLYFVNEYDLDYASALKGCSTDKDVPSSKIIELKNKAEDKKVNYIFIIELSDSRIAYTVVDQINNDIKNNKYDGKKPEIKTFYSMQNISKDDFNKNLTYVDFMNMNIELLKNLFD